MVQKTVIITTGTEFAIPDDFVSLVAIHAISAGGNGLDGNGISDGHGGIGGSYISITGADAGGFNLSAGALVNVQIGAGYDQSGNVQAAETWMQDADGTVMVLAPAGVMGWEGGFNPVTMPVPMPDDLTGGFTYNVAVPNDGRVSWGGQNEELSGGAAGGARKFVDSPSPLDSGCAGLAIHAVAIDGGRAQGGGGGAIVDTNGVGWPSFRGDGLIDASLLDDLYALAGNGGNNSESIGGGTLSPDAPNGTLGGGGRGGSPAVAQPVGEVDGGNGGNGQTWLDTSTSNWAGPGGGGGGGGGGLASSFDGNGGNGGLYGGGAGGGFVDIG